MLRKVVFSLALCLLACRICGAQDRSTPESTVRLFLSAFGSGDIKQAASCVKGSQMSGPAMDALAVQVKKDPATITLTDPKTTVTGNTATVTGQVSIIVGKEEKAKGKATQLNLALSDGTWQIVPDTARAERGPDQDMINTLAFMLTDQKVFTRARDAARATSCLSNMKQLCLGVLMFAQDTDDKLQIKPAAFKKAVFPYTKNEAIFKCPSDTGAGITYSFNGNLTGVKLARIKSPAETVMIYEGKGGKLDFRHDGRAAVGFADGRAKLIDAQAAKKLRWTP